MAENAITAAVVALIAWSERDRLKSWGSRLAGMVGRSTAVEISREDAVKAVDTLIRFAEQTGAESTDRHAREAGRGLWEK